MNTSEKLYCKLMYVFDYDYPENGSFKKHRYRAISKYLEKNVYVEEYDNFDSLIARINLIFQLEEYKKQNINMYSDEYSFPEFMVENRFGDYMLVGISTLGWNVSIYFFAYLMKYFEDKYGQQEGSKKYSQLADRKEILFCLDYQSEPSYASACNLVSDETAHIIIKEFLDTGKTEEDLDLDLVFEREIAKRNY